MYKSALVTAALLALTSASFAQVQHRPAQHRPAQHRQHEQSTRCPGNEFRDFSGKCVDPVLASDARCIVITMVQVQSNQYIRVAHPCRHPERLPTGAQANTFEHTQHGTGSTAP